MIPCAFTATVENIDLQQFEDEQQASVIPNHGLMLPSGKYLEGRELQFVQLANGGMSNAEIGDIFAMTEKSVSSKFQTIGRSMGLDFGSGGRDGCIRWFRDRVGSECQR